VNLKLKEKQQKKKFIQLVKIRNFMFILKKKILLCIRWMKKMLKFLNILNSKDIKKIFWLLTLKELNYYHVVKTIRLCYGI
jgi:hypothetical protein